MYLIAWFFFYFLIFFSNKYRVNYTKQDAVWSLKWCGKYGFGFSKLIKGREFAHYFII